MEGEECTAKRRCFFIILRPLRPFINCIFAPAWSAEEDRNNGHMDEVLIVTAIRISWIQEVTQVQVNKQLLTILHSSCWATKFCPSSAPSSSLHTGHLDSSYLQPATINMKTSWVASPQFDHRWFVIRPWWIWNKSIQTEKVCKRPGQSVKKEGSAVLPPNIFNALDKLKNSNK